MYHKTYRLSITLTKGVLTYPGEPDVKIEVEGGGHDQVLDAALDHLRTMGRKAFRPAQAPRLDFIPSSTIRTERYTITTVPLESVAAVVPDTP